MRGYFTLWRVCACALGLYAEIVVAEVRGFAYLEGPMQVETNCNGPSETTAETKTKREIGVRFQDLCRVLDAVYDRYVRFATCESELEWGKQAIRASYKQMAEECERYEVIPPRLDQDWQEGNRYRPFASGETDSEGKVILR